MAQPSPYARDYDFEGFQSGHPSTPLPGDKLNAELDAVDTAIEAILTNLALIQRDDTAVANKSIGWDQLKDELRHGFTTPTEWATGTAYEAGDQVYFGRKVYAAKVAHTSGTFNTDYNVGNWLLLADFTGVTAVDQSAQESAADAANSAAEAATAAATATTKATAASTSETNAAASAAAAAADAAELAVWSATYDPADKAAQVVVETDADASTFGFVLPDDDTLAGASATKLARSKNVKAYVDGKIIDEDNFASNSAAEAPSQQSTKAYVISQKLYLDARDYGVTGDGSDQSTALAAAVAALPASGYATLMLPPGNIVLNSSIGTISGKPVDIQGHSQTLIVPGFNGTVFDIQPGDVIKPVRMCNLYFAPGISSPITLRAINIEYPNPSAYSGRTVNLQDIYVISNLTASPDYYFNNGIRLVNAWKAYVSNVHCVGKANTNNVSGIMIELGANCTDAKLVNCKGSFWTSGFKFTAYSEGVTIVNPTLVDIGHGVEAEQQVLAPSVVGGHINAAIDCVKFVDTDQANVEGVLATCSYAASAININLIDCRASIVRGNRLITGQANVTGVNVSQSTTTSARNKIINNHMEGQTNGVWLKTGTTDCMVYGNTLFVAGVYANPVIDSGTNNRVKRFDDWFTTTVTLVGGAPQENATVTVPSWVTTRPGTVLASEGTQALAVDYDWTNSSATGGTVRLKFRTFSGVAIPAGTFNVTMYIAG